MPAVVNTSFNDNEPIVCRPEEAIDCFLRTRMDALVLGDFLIRRPAERCGVRRKAALRSQSCGVTLIAPRSRVGRFYPACSLRSIAAF